MTAATRPALATLAAALCCGACYRYVAVPAASVSPREEVRVQITPDAAGRIVKEFGAYTTELEGQYQREGPDSVSVSVLIGRDYRGVQLESARQPLFLGSSEIVAVRRRELSRGRTALVAAGAVAGFVALVATVTQLVDQNSNEDGSLPVPPPVMHVPRVTFRIPVR